MRIAIVDNYDSFTHNLFHIIEAYCENCVVMRNDKVDWDVLEHCDRIVFSPGPGVASETKIMGKILNKYAEKKPIFGVCLGMQYMALYFGAQIYNLSHPMHGVPRKTMLSNFTEVLYRDVPEIFDSARYHSWAVSKENFPSCLAITATDEDDVIMSIRHKWLDLCGVQFHPESVMTEFGKQMIKNWVQS